MDFREGFVLARVDDRAMFEERVGNRERACCGARGPLVRLTLPAIGKRRPKKPDVEGLRYGSSA